jgi:hypothetical protein
MFVDIHKKPRIKSVEIDSNSNGMEIAASSSNHNQSSLNLHKRIFFKYDMDPINYKRGRPFGGLAWVIDSEFEVLDLV